jgi:hypothetical protein
MKKMFNEGNQIHKFMSSSGSGSGSDFLTSYGSGYGSGSTSKKVTVPVPVPQHCKKYGTDPDPASQMNTDPSGSESATMVSVRCHQTERNCIKLW